MADVEGGLLKCVLQLAACSDKLRLADARLGKYVEGMKRDLPASEMPSLKSKLAIVPEGTANEEDTPEQQFEKLFELGTEAAERLEVTKTRMEKELRRRSEHFRELVSSRNMDIQEEYARMLKELEDQAEELKQDIEKERSAKEENRKRRREEREQRKAQKKSRHESLSHDNVQAQEQLEVYTADIRQLQNLFAEMEEEDEQAKRREEENARTEQERLEHLEGQLSAEVSELRQEITLLRETRDAINAKLETTTLKSQYEEERDEVKAEISHLQDKLQELTSQLTSNGVRLHSLLRTLAPTPSIGTLMTRLFQQLSPDRRSSSGGSPSGRESTDSSSQVSLKTVGLQEFLQSCPTVEEGRKAIDEMKKLQLIHYYESSGVIALAQ